MVANQPPMINSEDVYFLTPLGQSEFAATGTSLSRSELEVLVWIDGKAAVSQVQASAGHLALSEVIEVLDKLLRSEHIALQEFDVGDLFDATAPGEGKGDCVAARVRQPPLPDLVLLDVMLPDTDGFNVLARMRQHPLLGKVPVIMVTGTATREAVLKGLLGAATGYITKPFEIDVLVKAVKTVLGIEAGDQKA